MNRIISIIESIVQKVGSVVSWFPFLLAIVIGVDVIIRYFFKFTFIWITEIETYFFGILFLIASGYTFKHDKHVRVDVFYSLFSIKQKAWVNLLGGVFLLIPWCYVVLVSSWYYSLFSFSINEHSPQPGGLPALYLLKFCISIGFLILLLQGIATILKSLQILLQKK